ncbi:hypothetical protein SRB17_32370 [Streptomyces sp. RB17]|uniref:hypothetical protein n=1 Tax=Streptomyces sp. RB17 TaxID=2585197 RepID=UPI0012979450|nr:hypothetical protein [Streptomyces sp. RB17]MQY35264.1 hypothetical protein [Streptomyces sp. RB17]
MSSSLTFPAALLGPTVRVLRTAAGRRALQLVLLVGGLFGLGFLCGEQAHAADGAPVPVQAASVRAVGTAGHEDAGRAVRAVHAVRAVQAVRAVRAVPGVEDASAVQVVRAATERVATQVHSTGEQAVTPVRDVLTTVSRTVETAAAHAVVDGSRTSAPSLPLPDLAQVTDAPAQLTPEQKSSESGPQRYSGTAAPAPTEQKTQRHARALGRDAVGASAPVVAYGLECAPVSRPVAHAFARHGAAVGVPGRPAPTGDSDGVLGKQAADGSASRHGDAYAVTLDDRAPLRLVPGAAARVDAPHTRDRYRDIPVFPG